MLIPILLFGVMSLPLKESFDVAPPWEYDSTYYGRIEVIDGRLRMDGTRNGKTYRNKAIMHVDMSGQSRVVVSGEQWSLKDETTYSDGLFVSPDGDTWTKIYSWDSGGEFSIDLDATGIKYTSDFRIAFWQYDNYPAPYDGREFDNIAIYSEPPPEPDPPSSNWPTGLGLIADVFVDGGASLTSRRLHAAEQMGLTTYDLLTSSRSATRSVIAGNPSDTNGTLLWPDSQPAFAMYFGNGGNATGHGYDLGEAGRAAIRQFVLAGGSYTGSCASAYAIRMNVPMLQLWSGKMSIVHSRYSKSGVMSVDFSGMDQSHPFIAFLAAYNGSLLVPSIPHYYGPIFGPQYETPEGTEYHGTITTTSSAIYRSRGTPYLLEYTPSETSGVIFVQPSHPEYGRQLSHTALMQAEIEYAMLRSRSLPPDVKGYLEIGDAAEGIIGNGQYHLYEVLVPDGTQQLTVSVVGTENVDMYVQRDGYAHELSYTAASTEPWDIVDEIVIDDPEAGIWSIGVKGDHDTPNGTEYLLRAN